MSRTVAMVDTGADGSERAVAGRDTFREKQSAAVAAGARHMKMKAEEAEEDQTMSERETGGRKTKKKRKADDDGEQSRSKKQSRKSTASSAVAERAPPDAETVPTADLKRRTQGGTDAKGRNKKPRMRKDHPSHRSTESSSSESSVQAE